MTNNLDTQYINLLKDVLANGTKKADRTGVGTISKFGHTMRFNMAEGFPLLTTKKIFTKAMFHELLWFIQGGDNIKYLVDNDVRIWNEWPHKKYNETNPQKQMDMAEFVKNIKENREFAETWGDLGPVYGKHWVDWKGYEQGYNDMASSVYPGDFSEETKGVNQLDQVIDALKNNPDSRRIMVSAWNPSDLPKQLLPPCHYAWQVWSRELTEEERKRLAPVSDRMYPDHESLDEMNVPKRSISLMFQMRSVDCFLGAPFDIASYGTLLHMIGHCVNMVPGELIMSSGDTHIYLNHQDQVNELLDRTHFDLPTFKFDADVPRDIYKIKYEHLDDALKNYKCHPSIKANVAV